MGTDSKIRDGSTPETPDNLPAARREFLVQCGKFALATPPAVVLLLSTAERNYAVAASGRGPGVTTRNSDGSSTTKWSDGAYLNKSPNGSYEYSFPHGSDPVPGASPGHAPGPGASPGHNPQ